MEEKMSNKVINNTVRVAVFYGGKLTNHLIALKRAAKKEQVELHLFSYHRIYFDSVEGVLKLRDGNSFSLKNGREYTINDFDIVFIRTAKRHWQEVGWIADEVARLGKIIIDPIVARARVADALKANQMLQLSRAGVPIPKSLYGSRKFLLARAVDFVGLPMVVKGSGGHRGGSVYKVDTKQELERIIADLREAEIKEGRRFLVQEYIENTGDYRVIVLGDKVLGAMKRSRQVEGEFRNNFSRGGKVEVVQLPHHIQDLCVRAAKACGLVIAGVDLVFKNDDINQPLFWEVNRGPQFTGFMQATGIDVPREIVAYFKSLVSQNKVIL